MTQPTASPRFATDATYTSGPESGQPTKIAPGAGLVAQGFRPNKQYGAERFNYLVANHGDFLESIVDAPALTWSIPAQTPGMTNFTLATTRGRITPMRDVRAVGYEGRDLLLVHGSANMYVSRDGHTYESAGAHGLDSSDGFGYAAGVRADGVTYSIVGWNNVTSGAVRKTDNFGGAWAGAGTLPASAVATHAGAGGVHPVSKRFCIANGTNIFYSDTLAVATWGAIAVGGTTISKTWSASSPTELVFEAQSGGVQGLLWSSDGVNWQFSSLGNGTHGLRAAWSESHQLWVAVARNRRVYTAPAGFATWTLRESDLGGTSTGVEIGVVTLGRSTVAICDNGVFVSRDFANWRRLSPTPIGGIGSDLTWQHAERFNGRAYVARRYNTGSADPLEYTMSNALPAAFSEGAAW